ncbi:hypothetical protein PGT21_000031 [Puccinia graminis f. sp. tritici]|uniref:DUF300-domain-containing protein n=1 Tax=Puccinia graminis f. sp. tritici TaxID=56615 RepID=A0A5B0LRU4_PUCGR|nr:hypothetical protein PGT21_000031 [Puccinia graminis f. sp. tritici]
MLQSSILLLLALSLACVNAYECPEENKEEVDRDGFFTRMGHAPRRLGVMASIATIASLANIYMHCKNYNKPLEQRQIVRILLMPAIYSISSFFAYRYYRHYVYFAIIRDTYEAFVLASFLILCLLYVGRSPLEQQEVMKQKEKTPLCSLSSRGPFSSPTVIGPLNHTFLVATKWSVLQVLRDLATDDLGNRVDHRHPEGFSAPPPTVPTFANLWLTILIFISATLALYGLLITKHLAKEDLQGHRPTCKFMSIKIAVFLVFYQSFLLSFFDHLGFFQATEYWSRSNIADGVNALATTVEMAIVGLFQLYAFPYTEYRALIKGSEANRQKSVWKNFLHSQDYRDFGRDILMGLGFWLDRIRGAEYTKSRHATPQGAKRLRFSSGAHERPSSGTTQKGWADHEGGLDDVWDSKLGGQKQSQSFETCAEEPAYESLGQVDPQYPDPSSSPPYRSSPFADHPSDGRIPRSTDLDTLVHSSASSRHKRVDSEGSSHSADSQPGSKIGALVGVKVRRADPHYTAIWSADQLQLTLRPESVSVFL